MKLSKKEQLLVKLLRENQLLQEKIRDEDSLFGKNENGQPNSFKNLLATAKKIKRKLNKNVGKPIELLMDKTGKALKKPAKIARNTALALAVSGSSVAQPYSTATDQNAEKSQAKLERGGGKIIDRKDMRDVGGQDLFSRQPYSISRDIAGKTYFHAEDGSNKVIGVMQKGSPEERAFLASQIKKINSIPSVYMTKKQKDETIYKLLNAYGIAKDLPGVENIGSDKALQSGRDFAEIGYIVSFGKHDEPTYHRRNKSKQQTNNKVNYDKDGNMIVRESAEQPVKKKKIKMKKIAAIAAMFGIPVQAVLGYIAYKHPGAISDQVHKLMELFRDKENIINPDNIDQEFNNEYLKGKIVDNIEQYDPYSYDQIYRKISK